MTPHQSSPSSGEDADSKTGPKGDRQSEKIQTARSWIQSFLDWFRETPGPTSVNRESFNDRGRELLRQMRETPVATSARFAFLRRHETDLQGLFHDLMWEGNRHPAVALLGEALLKVEALSPSVPDDAAVDEAWEAVEKALADYLGDAVETGAAPRDGFWK